MSGGGPTSRWLHDKGCVLCHMMADKVIRRTTWGKKCLTPSALVHGNLSCAGDACGVANGWDGRAVYCSEDCRLHHEFELFAWEIGIRNY